MLCFCIRYIIGAKQYVRFYQIVPKFCKFATEISNRCARVARSLTFRVPGGRMHGSPLVDVNNLQR